MRIPRSLAFDILFGSNKGDGHATIDFIYGAFDEEVEGYVERMNNMSADCASEIQLIEEEFRTRICKNCEYAELGSNTYWCDLMKLNFSINFGCNEFKEKK